MPVFDPAVFDEAVFDAASGGGGGSNPITIMGAAAIWYADAAQPGLGQNADGSGAVADGDPVRFLPGLAGPNAVTTDTAREAIYRAGGGDPYLEGDASSQFRGTLSRSGDFYAILRIQFRGTGSQQDQAFCLATDTATFYFGSAWANVTLNPFVGPQSARMEVGSGTQPPLVTTTRDTWITVEIYGTATVNALAVNGSAFVTGARTGAFPTTAYFDIFNSTEAGQPHPDTPTWFRRGAILNAIPNATQRAALLTWATDGDPGGGSDVSVAPGVGSVAVAGLAPTLAAAASVAPGVGAVAIIGLAPTVTVGAGVTVTPGVGSVAIAGLAPVVAAAATASAAVGAVAISGLAPTVTAAAATAPGVGSVAIAGLAPSVVTGAGVTVAPGVGSVAISGLAPALAANSIVLPGVGAVAMAGLAPAVTAAAVITPGVGSVSILGIAPVVDVGGGGGEIGRKFRAPVGLLPTGRLMGQ